MNRPSIDHATLVFERVYPASPARVFAAYADVDVRTRWGTPSDDEAISYSESDFRVGGSDIYRCGLKHDLRYRGVVKYEDVVTDERIVFTETVRDDDALLSVSLVTWEIHPEAGGGTRLVVTDQVASMVGAEMVVGSEAGVNASLDNLGAWLQQQPSSQGATR